MMASLNLVAGSVKPLPVPDIQRVALGVDRRRVPNTGSGRTKYLFAVGGRLDDLRLVGNRVRCPDHLSGDGIKRRYRAATGAALVQRLGALYLLQRGDGHVEPVFVEPGGRRNPRDRM